MPERWRMPGEPTEPAHRTISLRALKVFAWSCQRALTAEARPFFQQHAVDFDVGQHRQIGTVADWFEKRLGRVPADPGFLVDLEIAAAFVVALIEVIDAGDAALLGRRAEGVEDRP